MNACRARAVACELLTALCFARAASYTRPLIALRPAGIAGARARRLTALCLTSIAGGRAGHLIAPCLASVARGLIAIRCAGIAGPHGVAGVASAVAG
jgi:hypothetical protein